MKRVLLLVCCLFTVSLFGQYNEPTPKKSFKERMFLGGGVILNFSSSGFIVGASPTVGYRITDRWDVGVGASVLYSRFGFQGLRFDNLVYGGSTFTRYDILQGIFAQAEFQVVNTNAYNQLTGEDEGRKTVPLLYLGGGLRQSLGGNLYALIFLLYDVVDSPYSPYQNPFYRAGIVWGLR